MSELLEELREEQFDEPDDEHSQVSIGNEHWAVTAQVSGLITFDNIDLIEGVPSDLPECMYLRNVSDDTLKTIWRSIVNSDEKTLLSFAWAQLNELMPYQRDYYRSAL
ncbi:hypothetical protein [Chitinimonas sp. JJ19]|uniref:hypothetical protein n=1 Tax=Chitinimonas sp. JJ19 TaxID=3109352 RepID=UPI002FFFC02F